MATTNAMVNTVSVGGTMEETKRVKLSQARRLRSQLRQSNQLVAPEQTTRRTRSSANVAALSLTIPEPPRVGLEVDTTLGPGRLLYPIASERWIVLVGTKGYVAEINVEEATEDEQATSCDQDNS